MSIDESFPKFKVGDQVKILTKLVCYAVNGDMLPIENLIVEIISLSSYGKDGQKYAVKYSPIYKRYQNLPIIFLENELALYHQDVENESRKNAKIALENCKIAANKYLAFVKSLEQDKKFVACMNSKNQKESVIQESCQKMTNLSKNRQTTLNTVQETTKLLDQYLQKKNQTSVSLRWNRIIAAAITLSGLISGVIYWFCR